MKFHISIHISPYEIDNYQLFIHQLRRNLNYIEDDIIFNPCLNLSSYFYNWDESPLNKSFFIDKFNNLNKIISEIKHVDPIINLDQDILGALSFKRYFINQYKNEVDAFIWFDSDILFPDDTIHLLIESFKNINQKCCIITPQIPKLWDNTWDVIVNEQFIDNIPSHDVYNNFDGYTLYVDNNEKNLIENVVYTKFAAGWGNLLSSNLFKDYIDLDDSLGHYGIDDTFIMYAVDIYKQKGIDIKQYIVENLVVTENNKYKISSYDRLILKNQNIKTKEDFRQESEQGMLIKLNKLNNENIL